jgi:hypothetical protein
MWKTAVMAATATLLAFAAACGDDDDEATPTPSVCDQKEALEASVQELTDLNILASGTDGLKEAVGRRVDLARARNYLPSLDDDLLGPRRADGQPDWS